jgi:hypothetical protein
LQTKATGIQTLSDYIEGTIANCFPEDFRNARTEAIAVTNDKFMFF